MLTFRINGNSRIRLLSLFIISLIFTSVIQPIPSNAAAGKVTICHRTKSVTNPYRLITVSQSAATNNAGHKNHTGGVFNTTADFYVANAKNWGDIIPGADADGAVYNGSNAFDLNWTATGKTFFPGGINASKCGRMTPKQFYDLQVANGVSAADAIADLNSQNANEDAEILAALGGSFSTSNIASSDGTVGVTTTDATSISTTGATLNGSVKANSTPMKWQFEYGTSSDLSTGTTITTLSATGVTGTSATVTVTESKNSDITGLTSGTTYYFRIIGVTNSGTDTEAIYYGDIKSFTASNPTAQAIDFVYSTGKTYGDSSFSVSATSKTPTIAGAATGLTVSFSSQTGTVCSIGSSSIAANVSSATVTILSAGDCTLRASQAGGMTGATNYAAADPVDQTFTISPKSITVTAEDKSKNFGASDPTFTYTYSASFVGSDAVSSVSRDFAGKPGTTYASSATIPTAVGTYSITPTAVALSPGTLTNYTFMYVAGTYTISVGTPSVSTTTLPDGTVSSAYSTTLAATGGSGSYTTWALTVGTLPDGLTLNAGTGVISGTPTTAGTSNITVTVTDSNTQTSAGKALSITINAVATPSVSTNSLPSGTVSSSYSTTLAGTGGSGTYSTWAITAGTLPAGLTLNTSTGVISGTPTTAGTSNITVTVTDSNTQTSAGKALSITINAAAVINNPSPQRPQPQNRPVTPPNIIITPQQNPAGQNPSNSNNNGNNNNQPNRQAPIPLPTATIPIIDDQNNALPILEAKVKEGPVIIDPTDDSKINVTIPIGYSGKVKVEIQTEENQDPQVIELTVEGPKPPIVPREDLIDKPRILDIPDDKLNIVSLKDQVNVSWKPVDGAEAYEVKRNGELVCLTVYATCNISAENRALENYTVSAVNQDGERSPVADGQGRALAKGTLLAIVYFKTDRSGITKQSRETLEKLVNELQILGLRNVSLAGHTDTRQSVAYNERLSQRRSLAVSEWLSGALIDTEIVRRQFGERQPAATEDDEVGLQENRRVEIRVV